MKKELYFIRHAESPFIFGSERERPLSDKGVEDSFKIQRKLDSIDFDLYVCSPYKRALQTIEPLSQEKNIIIYESLKEKQLKGNYKLASEEIEKAIKESFINKDMYLKGGESTYEVQKRAIPIIEELLENDYKNIIIGTHGNILTCILNYYDNSIGYDFWKNSSKPDIYIASFENKNIVSINRLNYEG
ncbi:histidine phosphatase family protein [Mammaliicoccus vitulinus]|uniref:histidine phosphatase family protein n=1 Tax=Mammaliicoccus vitulinus TaxID=71237 RepID=UPI000D1DB2D4|nr:phosphoglycerate mutase family protein [Mammaliicoccus vitulinus]PTI68602.1 histidine phosphatase family protein [Mammaliicoccus vitulinus]